TGVQTCALPILSTTLNLFFSDFRATVVSIVSLVATEPSSCPAVHSPPWRGETALTTAVIMRREVKIWGDSRNCLLTMGEADPILVHSPKCFIDLLRSSNVCSTI